MADVLPEFDDDDLPWGLPEDEADRQLGAWLAAMTERLRPIDAITPGVNAKSYFEIDGTRYQVVLSVARP